MLAKKDKKEKRRKGCKEDMTQGQGVPETGIIGDMVLEIIEAAGRKHSPLPWSAVAWKREDLPFLPFLSANIAIARGTDYCNS